MTLWPSALLSVPSSWCAGVVDRLSNCPLNASLSHRVYLSVDNEIVDKKQESALGSGHSSMALQIKST